MEMKKTVKFLFIGMGFILASSLMYDFTKISYDTKYKHANAHACGDLKTLGIIYCFDETNPNYMTIPLYENFNEKKTFMRLKDDGAGLSIIVFENKINKYNEVLSKVRFINKGYDGWVHTKLVQFD